MGQGFIRLATPIPIKAHFVMGTGILRAESVGFPRGLIPDRRFAHAFGFARRKQIIVDGGFKPSLLLQLPGNP